MKLSRLLLVLSFAGLFSACSNDDDTTPVIPPSDGSQLKLEGGGGTGAPNTVYVDFSADKQTDVPRTSWSLGFYSGAAYRVILNGFSSMSAVALNKTDISQVTLDDSTGIRLAVGQGQGVMSLIDDVYGDLTKTVIAEVSATDADNKIYLVKPEAASASDPATWYKIRVTRGSSGYALQYAKLGETTIKTAAISKAADYNFVFFSLEGGNTVTVEPKKAEWDIAWSYAAYFTPYMGTNVPYPSSDFVVINHLAGVQAAQVDSNTVSYANFKESNITGLTFVSTRDAIGTKWRSLGGQNGGATGIYKNLYYIVKDPAGNYYKLKFVSMGVGDGGSRGYPEIEYKLVKAGS